MSRNLLDRRSLSIHSGGDNHRVARLLLDMVTAVLENRHTRLSYWLNDAAWNVAPGHNATTSHVHRWVHRPGTSRITWPFTEPGQLDHRFAPCIWTTAPLNGVARKVDHDDEEDQDWNVRLSGDFSGDMIMNTYTSQMSPMRRLL